jgi:3-dehydroquinate synthase
MKIIKVSSLSGSAEALPAGGNFDGVYYFDATFAHLEQVVNKQKTVLITDSNVFQSHQKLFDGWQKIVLPAGEEHKQQSTVDFIVKELIAKKADRNTFIVGVGGGVVTDITGYAASIYMRGVKFGFVPTTILAMVDASIGGKNGVDVGVYKNLVGLIKQPEFLLFDYALLQTLPTSQWINGFAEVIKHACIKDAALFSLLQKESIESFKSDSSKLAALIEKNVQIKTAVVVNDEFEQGDRKLLNFGHTLGHAIENMYQLPHGHAVSIGMMAAAEISSSVNNFPASEARQMKDLLEQYHLPTQFNFDKEKIWEILRMDKKRASNTMNFILLNIIGQAMIQPITMNELENLIH